MPAPNLFEELKEALNDFETFLNTNVPIIKPAIVALKPIIPQIGELLTKLIELMGRLRAEIVDLDLGSIATGALANVATFTQGATRLLEAAKNLLPNQAAAIDQTLAIASVASSLPSFADLKAEILRSLDVIVTKLNELNAP